MYKYTISFAAKIVLFQLFFQIQVFSIYSPEQSFWARPFKQCWAYHSDQIIADKIASDNAQFKTVVIPSVSGNLTAIDTGTGEVLWNTEMGGKITSKPFFYNGSIYLLIETQAVRLLTDNTDMSSLSEIMVLRSIDPLTGLTKRERVIRSVKQFFVSENEGKVVFVDEKNNFHLSGLEGGDSLFEISGQRWVEQVSTVGFAGQFLIVGTLDREILLLSATTGVILKRFSSKGIPDNVILDGDRLVWTDTKGIVSALSLRNEKSLWRRKGGAAFLGMSHVRDAYLLPSVDNFLYMLDADSGDIVWKKRFDNKPLSSFVVDDNIGVVLAFDSNVASILNLEDGKIFNTITLSDANLFLTPPLVFRKGLIFTTSEGLYFFTASDCGKIKTQ